MAKTLEDWQDAYYEQQANHTEATGMLAQERDSWKRKYESACADAHIKEAKAAAFGAELGRLADEFDAKMGGLGRELTALRLELEQATADPATQAFLLRAAKADNAALRERIASLEQLAGELHTEVADLVTHNAALREALKLALPQIGFCPFTSDGAAKMEEARRTVAAAIAGPVTISVSARGGSSNG